MHIINLLAKMSCVILHLICPLTTFYGVARQDKCLVSLTLVLCKFPQLHLAATRDLCAVNKRYTISNIKQQKVQSCFDSLRKK